MDVSLSRGIAKQCIQDLGFDKISPDILEGILAAAFRWYADREYE